MQYDAKTPQEYMTLLEDDWRKEKLLVIRDLVHKHAPEWEEYILYKMLSYGIDGTAIFGLNAQKHYVSLYVGTIDKVEHANELLAGFEYGKGCIRVRKSIQDLSGLERFIEATVAIWRSGGDTDC